MVSVRTPTSRVITNGRESHNQLLKDTASPRNAARKTRQPAARKTAEHTFERKLEVRASAPEKSDKIICRKGCWPTGSRKTLNDRKPCDAENALYCQHQASGSLTSDDINTHHGVPECHILNRRWSSLSCFSASALSGAQHCLVAACCICSIMLAKAHAACCRSLQQLDSEYK